MLLSVIIPTCHRNDMLALCLDRLAPGVQTINEAQYEVIVTDDGTQSTAESLIHERYPWCSWVAGPRKGPAANRNYGAKQGKGDWLIFIDDDCIPDKELLINYSKEIINGNYKGIEGYINADRPKERFDEQSPLNLKGGCFWSCNIAVDKKVFERIGGFDERFPFAAMEDIDFYHRLKLVCETTFLENAKVIHPWRRTKAFKSYHKWIVSNQYLINKTNTNKDVHYRISRFKVFIGSFVNNTKEIINYSFKGIGFYFEVNWFYFLMIFK
ncbi:MAG: glycosyltransferase [Algoriphagus sp.]|uniref:glycosyltransferase family 2 protein n=1 Tax=Algoriphagus sp. TaxID=1872435 RepID=UPI0018509B36|nr:glycosyltransferase [Algoriphagus sp.]NVJ85999.1 glycosyltransferase [Algoriphagus sp.]